MLGAEGAGAGAEFMSGEGVAGVSGAVGAGGVVASLGVGAGAVAGAAFSGAAFVASGGKKVPGGGGFPIGVSDGMPMPGAPVGLGIRPMVWAAPAPAPKALAKKKP